MKLYPETPLFLTLATELVEHIADVLDNHSLFQLRLTCHTLQTKTFHHFARRCFSSIKTDLSEISLARINALSQHHELRQYVQGLAFMLQGGLGQGLVWDRHPWGPLAAPMEMEPIRRLRENIIHNFGHCRSFYILCRYPEGHPDLKHMTITDAVTVFFAMIADAKMPVSSFHLIYSNQYSRTLIMDMRRVPKLLYRQPGFKNVWSNLKKLSLEQYLTLENFGFLFELVLSASNLQTLLLNLGSHDLACEFMHELAETGSFSQLQELALFRTLVRASDLIKILDGMQNSLATLTLYHVSLATDDIWNSVLKELAWNFSALKSVSLYYLWATAPTKEMFVFPDLQKEPTLCETTRDLHLLYSEKPIQNPSVLGLDYSGEKVSQILSLLQTKAAST